jgi:hypothetical protein
MKRVVLKELDAALRQEAKAIRGHNGFSRLVHERCMEALRQKGLPAAGDERADPYRLWRIAVPVGVAAAVAVAAWMSLQGPPTEPAAPQKIAGEHPTAPVLPVPIGPQIQGPAQATNDSLEERKYAYLDRDAQHLLTFLADQLPDFGSAADSPKAPESPR